MPQLAELIIGGMETVTRRPKAALLTEENRQESAKLKALYNQTPHKLTQAAFGETYGIGNQGAVWQCLNGKGMPISLKAAQGFARGLNCQVADFSPRLAAEIEQISRSRTPDEDEYFVMVERADVAFSNGRGKVVFVEGKKAPLSFRRDYLRKLGVSEKNAVIVDADGRSNEPTITDGAVLLVNRSAQQIQNGKLYAFRHDNQLLVKRLHQQADGTVLAIPDNPDREEFPEQRYRDDGKDFELIGRVLWMAAEL